MEGQNGVRESGTDHVSGPGPVGITGVFVDQHRVRFGLETVVVFDPGLARKSTDDFCAVVRVDVHPQLGDFAVEDQTVELLARNVCQLDDVGEIPIGRAMAHRRANQLTLGRITFAQNEGGGRGAACLGACCPDAAWVRAVLLGDIGLERRKRDRCQQAANDAGREE